MEWSDVHYYSYNPEDEAFLVYLKEIRKICPNGQVGLYAFRPVSNEIFDEALKHSFHDRYRRLKTFAQDSTVSKNLASAKIFLEDWMTRAFHLYSPYEMEGCLTALLVDGSVDQVFEGSEDDARFMSRNFMNSVGYSRTEVFKIEAYSSTKALIAFNSILRRWVVFYLVNVE